jgi:hypothetical protein
MQRSNEMLRSYGQRPGTEVQSWEFRLLHILWYLHTRNKDGLLQQSDLICIDFDMWLTFLRCMKNAQWPLLWDRTTLSLSSGDGLKWIIQVFRKGWEHSRFFQCSIQLSRSKWLSWARQIGSDVSRSCFIPHDPEAYINPKYNNVKDENFFTRRMGECPF